MNRLSIYRLLWRNSKLSDKRNPAFEQGVAAKVLMWIGAGITGTYMIVLGAVFGRVAVEDDNPALLLLLMPILLLIDFLLRFMVQQTPLVFVKPYLLMPMKTARVVEAYLISQLGNLYNLLWFCLFLPYAFVCIVGGISVGAAIMMVLVGMLLVFINSQWYLIVRTLIVRSLLWWLLPLAVYAAWIVPLFLTVNGVDVLEHLADTFSTVPMLCLLALILIAILVGLLLINRQMQFRFIYQEISREQKKPSAIKHVSQFTFLERFGHTGEYLKLELKSIMRNKAIRTRVIMSLGLIVMFSLLLSYTNVYDGKMILNFWCYYCFAIYGMTALTKVMGPEGNYIDLLMTQRENILALLKAKYYFHVAILLVPLVIMLPAVIAGKFTILMMLAYMFLTGGLGYLIMFQLAVYNKQTLPLDAKLTGKNNVESGFQLVIELVGMFLPLLLVGGMLAVTEEETAYTIIALFGLALTIAHPWWLRNIYNRMMKRKYANLEGFHATR